MFAYAPTAHLPVCDCRRKAGSLGSSSATSSSILVAFSIGGDANGVGLSCERARLYAGLNPLAKGPAISRHESIYICEPKMARSKENSGHSGRSKMQQNSPSNEGAAGLNFGLLHSLYHTFLVHTTNQIIG